MLIEQVKQALKEGKKISRHSWEGKVVIYYVNKSERDFFIGEKDRFYQGLIGIAEDGNEYECYFNGEMLFADDWYVIG